VVLPLEEHLARGGSIDCIAFVLAAWFRYLRGVDEHGQPIAIVDPLRPVLTDRAQQQQHSHDPAPLLAVALVFEEHLVANTTLASAVKDCLEAIDRVGMQQACATSNSTNENP